VVQVGVEACDDGNEVDTDACRNLCESARCGDGVVQEGVEACDDGNQTDTDGCTNACAEARCGDSLVQDGVETCDDGNEVDGDACTNACADAVCGDGIVRVGVEACDDGNEVDTDACRDSCVVARCGDGVTQAGVEACDDGNNNNDDACRNDCSLGIGNYLGMISVGNLYQSRDALEQHNQRCNQQYGGNAHQCTRAEIDANNNFSRACNDTGGHVIVNDSPRWNDGYGYLYMCRSCGGGDWGNNCNGQPVPCCG